MSGYRIRMVESSRIKDTLAAHASVLRGLKWGGSKRSADGSKTALYLLVAALILAEGWTAIKLVEARRAAQRHDGPEYMAVQSAYDEGRADAFAECDGAVRP